MGKNYRQIIPLKELPIIGPRGQRGVKGKSGTSGSKGERGETGERGIQGPIGLRGAQGLTGAKGDQGIQGLQGPMGEPGPKGNQGERGERGLEGPRGPKGIQGEKGPKGKDGKDGKDATNIKVVKDIVANKERKKVILTVKYTDGSDNKIVINQSGDISFIGGGTGTPVLPTLWGNIGGTLSNQSDLQAALDSKLTDVYDEEPAITNGSPIVTLANTPTASTYRVYLNGQRMREGSGHDFTISGAVITFEYNLKNTPGNPDHVQVDYKYS